MSAGKPRIPRDWKPYVDAAIDAGWTIKITGKNHPRLIPPPGTQDPYRGGPAAGITFAASPSDYRALRAFAADLRRLGIKPKEK